MKSERTQFEDGSAMVVKFDDDGNQIEINDISDAGKVFRIVYYYYDDKSNVTGWKEYKDGMLSFDFLVEYVDGIKCVKMYDSEGHLLEISPYDD
jgi:hypothetical protein